MDLDECGARGKDELVSIDYSRSVRPAWCAVRGLGAAWGSRRRWRRSLADTGSPVATEVVALEAAEGSRSSTTDLVALLFARSQHVAALYGERVTSLVCPDRVG